MRGDDNITVLQGLAERTGLATRTPLSTWGSRQPVAKPAPEWTVRNDNRFTNDCGHCQHSAESVRVTFPGVPERYVSGPSPVGEPWPLTGCEISGTGQTLK